MAPRAVIAAPAMIILSKIVAVGDDQKIPRATFEVAARRTL
jgi:hypothetical protein